MTEFIFTDAEREVYELTQYCLVKGNNEDLVILLNASEIDYIPVRNRLYSRMIRERYGYVSE